MPIVVTLDVMLARRKMRGKELAARIGMSEQNLSLLRAGRAKGVRFETLAKICAALDCQPGDLLAHAADARADQDVDQYADVDDRRRDDDATD